MEVPITQFRRDIFELANRALDGETITVAYKGKRLTLVPEAQLGSRWEKKTDLKIIHPDHPNLDDDDLKAEMQADWEKDWAEL